MEEKLSLTPFPGSITKKKKIVGRGLGSGKGRTSGKGHKGYKARSGNGKNIGFEGGQMPLIRRLPKIGFTSLQLKNKKAISLEIIEKKFSNEETIDIKSLKAKRLINKKINKIKIVNKGKLTKKVKIGKGVRLTESVKKIIN